MSRFEDAPPDGTARSAAFSSPDSGVWARPRSDSGRPQDRPLPVPRPLAPWFSWCLALAFFAGIGALVIGTLLELTSELVELGHQGSVSDSRTR